MARCPDEQTLTMLAKGELSDELAAATEAHLEKCRRCAEALANLPVDQDLVARLRDLESSRSEIESALKGLAEVERRTATTLFGDEPG